MEAWTWGLVLKPLIAVVLFLVVFGGARLLALAIYRVLPDSKIKRELFRTKPSDSDQPPSQTLPARKDGR